MMHQLFCVWHTVRDKIETTEKSAETVSLLKPANDLDNEKLVVGNWKLTIQWNEVVTPPTGSATGLASLLRVAHAQY